MIKKSGLRVIVCIALFSLLCLPSSCAKGVTKEDYDKLSKDLSDAKFMIASLDIDNEVRAENMAEASVYASFLDLLMYQSLKEEGIPVRFNFADEASWLEEVFYRASVMEDQKLIDLLHKTVGDGLSINLVADYCIAHIREALRS
ncbi:MAG: hypothetical protein ABIB93_01495 [Chloroflexota bacterium]